MYKRQMILGAREHIGISEKLLFLIFGIVFGLGGELMSILAYKTKERVEFVTPVSYTHLDVYKRQVMMYEITSVSLVE